MSYHLNFIKKKDLTIQQSLDYLEKKKISKEDQYSEAEKKQMIAEIVEMNQHKEINTEKNTTTIDFDSFQVTLNNTQLGVSIPYLKENLAQKVIVQVNCMISIFLENGSVGIDSQREKLIDDDYSFKKSFSQSLDVVSASVETDKKGQDFDSKEAAEKFYFKERDKVLSLVEPLKVAFPKKKFDFSPESLKHLEWAFYEGLDNEEFGKSLPTKEMFYKLLSMYKAKVYVSHKAYQWKICENFYHKTFQLAIQNKKGMHTIFISPRENFEDFPDTKKQALLKEYLRQA